MEEEDWVRFRQGVDLFNAGRFWQAHEAWEDVWRRKAGDCEYFFKGLIQAAAAFHQFEQGRYRGMMTHFSRACGKLKPFVPEYLGIDTAGFVRDLERCRESVEKPERENGGPISLPAIPRIGIV